MVSENDVQEATSGDEIHGDSSQYTKRALAIYDSIVLGFMLPAVWRCPKRVLLDAYDRNVGARHLDLGPGTGYFLDRCHFSVPNPEITLADLSADVLDKVSHRINRYKLRAVQADLLHPLQLDGERFDSVGMMNFLHCLPGGMERKAMIFTSVQQHLLPGGKVFGSTVLGTGVPQKTFTRIMMRECNRKKMFYNMDDSLGLLDAELAKRFAKYTITLHGVVALFEAAQPV